MQSNVLNDLAKARGVGRKKSLCIEPLTCFFAIRQSLALFFVPMRFASRCGLGRLAEPRSASTCAIKTSIQEASFFASPEIDLIGPWCGFTINFFGLSEE